MSAIEDLAAQWWDAALAAEPVGATLVGVHDHDDRVGDPSAAAEQVRRADVMTFQQMLGSAEVAAGEQVVAAMLRATVADELVGLGDPAGGEPSLALLGCEQMEGPHQLWLRALPQATYPDPDHAAMVPARYAAAGAHLAAAADRFDEALERGLPPVRRSVERVLGQVDRFLTAPLGDDPLVAVAGPGGWDGEQRWRAELADAVRDEVRPALVALRERVAADQLPPARGDEHPGLVHVEGGEALYARCVRLHTGLARDPQAVHDTGVDYVAGPLAEEWSRLGSATHGEDDPARLMERLREDPSLQYGSGQEMLDHARAAVERATAAAPAWFGTVPDVPCEVVEAPAHLAGSGPPAWYVRPAPDGSRPGRYHLDTLDGGSMLRSEGEATAFHEAVPGHHLQLSLAVGLTHLPPFMRHAHQVAHSEGWGLYAERLADEMGLYTGDRDRLGMLALDAFRAGRLVVDTGLHALGWSRGRAVEWLMAHTPLPRATVEAEVDRYVAMPGQALAYKLGQLEIVRLRREAERALGGGFDLAGFHDAVLGHGPVTLGVLDELVGAWVSTHSA